MFIHYGLYSVIGRHEWVMNRERIPVNEYENVGKEFTATNFDPGYYAGLAKEAGMKYMVLTAKHHEGFCLWNTKTSPYNVMNTPAERDLVAEYTDTVRSAGLGVGLYFSLMDWHHPDGAKCLHDAKARERFVAYVHAQVEELMTSYGRIDILWYDVPWPLKPDGWDSLGLNYMVRSLQPRIIINNRSIQPEDFTTPEQKVNPAPPYRAWETCMTMNGSWGYNRADTEWKPVKDLLAVLIRAAAGGGNLVLNVGPEGDGSIPEESVGILKKIGAWLERNGKAVYGSERAAAEWMNCGMATQKGNTLYWHITRWYGNELWIGGVQTPVNRAYILGTGQEVKFDQELEPAQRLRLYDLPEESPDPYIPVIALECGEKPVHRLGAGVEWIDGVLPLAGEMGI
jgi:alpha-L-fucosidase